MFPRLLPFGATLLVALTFTPSPLHAQAPAAVTEQALAAPVIHQEGAGAVTITCSTPGTVIRYSIDNSDPGPKGGPYLAPITLPSGGVVKARAYSEDRKQKSELAELAIKAPEGVKPVPSTLVPCTQDRDWPVYDWAKRHAAVSQIVHERHPTLLFIGDSITQMFGGEPHDRGQPGKDVWEEHYVQRNVANLGFGYDFIENTLWRLQHGELEGAAAKAIVIHIGTNNVGRNSVEEIVAGVRAICAEVHQRQPSATIVLMAIFPRGPKPDAIRAKLDSINQQLATMQGQGGVTFLDIGPKFLEPDGSITRETMGDFLHPTAKGYTVWADALEPVLAKLLGDSAK